MGGGGAKGSDFSGKRGRVSELFLQRIQKKFFFSFFFFFFFWEGGGTRVSEFFLQRIQI